MAGSQFLEQTLYANERKRFFPTRILAGHHQLKHCISSPTKNIIYYIHHEDVFRIDTRTKKRTYLVQLPFSARCLATGYGWLCVGGDSEGDFAAFRIAEDRSQNGRPGEDASASSGSGSGSADESVEHLFDSLMQERRAPYHHRFGGHLVNSVTLTKMKFIKDGLEGEDVVAILTNNDGTVKMYALNERVDIWQDEHEVPPNHASVSPDGTLLFVVGDEETGYIYERLPATSRARGKPSFPTWDLLRTVRLHRPQHGQPGKAAYFTTAFSANGQLFATASEYGFVQIFDVQRLRDVDEDPLMAIVPSSNPSQYPGAVRSMIFAPSPLDLLIWTENHETVCITDLRTGLLSRQTISLKPQDPDVERCELIDSRRRLDESTLAEDELDREHLRQLTLETNESSFPSMAPLTHDEQTQLRFLRTARELAPTGSDESSSQQASRTTSSTTPTNTRATRPSTIGPARAPNPRTMLPIYPHIASELAEDVEISDDYRLRRRSLGLLNTETGATHTSSRVRLRQAGRRNVTGAEEDDNEDDLPELRPTTTANRRQRNGSGPTHEAYNRQLLSLVEAERAQARRRGHTPRPAQEPDDESLTSLGYSVRAREQRANDPTADYESYFRSELGQRRGGVLANLRRRHADVLGAIGESRTRNYSWSSMVSQMPTGMHVPPQDECGVEIVGMDLSPDGRILYVGTVDGIFELEMNMKSRKFKPAIELS